MEWGTRRTWEGSYYQTWGGSGGAIIWQSVPHSSQELLHGMLFGGASDFLHELGLGEQCLRDPDIGAGDRDSGSFRAGNWMDSQAPGPKNMNSQS